MPTISIITAVLAGKHQYLHEAYDSLASQEMPVGWDWQWVIQEDGESGIPLADLPDDPRISTGTGPRGRAAMARTIAIGRANGLLLRTLDADDVLPAGALNRDITTLMTHPEISWCVSPALDLLPDGTLRAGPRDPDAGPLPPGYLAEGEQAGLLQVVGTTMCTYTQLVRALGAWQALPREEDVALLLAAEAVADGWMLAEVGLHYRRWPGNTTEEVDKRLASAGSPQRDVLLGRADALRTAGWRWSPQMQHADNGRVSPLVREAGNHP